MKSKGAKIKYNIPHDFKNVYDTVKGEGKLSVNYLREYYDVKSPSIIERWLSESELSIEKNNYKKEEKFDLFAFKEDCESNKFTIKGISEKYKIRSHNIREVCRRNHIKLNLLYDGFDVSTEEFKKILDIHESIVNVALFYSTTPAVISGYIKRKNIKIEKYWGRKIKIDIDSFKIDCVNDQLSFRDICKKYKISSSAIRRIAKENDIKIPDTSFKKWENQYSQVLENIEKYKKRNKAGESLLDISQKDNISIEHVKKVFKEKNIPIVLHSYNKSNGELEIKKYISSLGFECYSTKKIFNNKIYEIDCFVPEKNFGVEYCGEYWHSVDFEHSKSTNYHQDKYAWCKEQGIRLMTIFESEWLYKQEIVKSMIRNRLGLSEKIFARKTVAKIISSSEAKRFHKANHINGYVNSSLNYGLFYENKLMLVLSLSKSRFDKKYEYEITRLSTKQNFIIVGGFSKVLKFSKIKSLITYADLRFGDGNVYLNNGFKKLSTTPSNYWYYHRNNSSELESRMKYQKKNLVNMSGYSIEKTEQQIMSENGFFRIYDCGSNKFALE